MKVHVPPIKCQGIKTKLVPQIKQLVEWNGKGKWIEPFSGSGVVGFNVLPKQALFCDTNPHIINFYNEIKSGNITSEKSRLFLEKEGELLSQNGAEHYYLVRERFNTHKNPLDFLFLNRSCFNGMVRFNSKGEFNVPFGHKPNRFAKAYITKIANQIAYVQDALTMNEWEFKDQDFRLTLTEATNEDFIYCDPPYIGRHVDYYNGWTEENEQVLHQLLTATNANFILSTWHSNEHRKNVFIDTHWSDFYMITQEHFYHVGAKEKNRKPMLEALFTNYRPIFTEESFQIEQLSLFEPKSAYYIQESNAEKDSHQDLTN